MTIDEQGRDAAARMRARLDGIAVPEPRAVVRRARHRRQIAGGVVATAVVAVTVAIVASLVGGSPKPVEVESGGITSSSIGSTGGASSTRASTTQPPTTSAATTSTSRPTSTSASPVTITPTVTIGSWTGREPVMIYFSGDSGDITRDLKWSTWTPDLAVAHGTWQYLDCVPNCAQGTSTPYPVTITLTLPEAGQFTRLLEQTDGPHGYNMTFSAPDLGQGACTTSNQSSCTFR